MQLTWRKQAPCSSSGRRSLQQNSFGTLYSFQLIAWPGIRKDTNFLPTYISDPCNDTLVWDAILSDLRLAAEQGVGGWHFCLLFANADEEQCSTKWGLPSYNDPMDVCSECLSNRSNRPFSDLPRTARWRPSEDMTVDCYIARIRANPRHPLASSCFFLHDGLFNWMSCTCLAAKVWLL